MCPLRAYGGHPTLVCLLGQEDMQRFRPDVLITFYVTASVAGRALGPQVVAIFQKRNQFRFQWPRTIPGRIPIMKTTMVLMEEWSQCPTLGPKMTHPMPKKWTRKEVAMANHLRKTTCMTLLPIPRTLPATRRPRNPSVCY